MSRAWMPALPCLLLAGCGGVQSALDPHGPFAGRISLMSWIIFGGATLIFLITMAFLWNAVRGSRAEQPRITERGGWVFVAMAGVVVPAVVLLAFLVYSVSVANVNASAIPEDGLTIEVTARQWWWDFRYRGDYPSDGARTSNEIHIPVGRPVRMELRSSDVIHSFWVPNLHGKMDMIPGRTNTIALQADRPGVFRGQCAEFCGLQHALMGFVVVAEPQEQFDAWLAHQRSPAAEPVTAAQHRGQEVFLSSSCSMCHAVRGTIAMAAVAPDLTHLGSRRTLAAATVPNRRGYLGGWIVDPQSLKPGNHMPPNQLPSEDLTALIDYLESLK